MLRDHRLGRRFIIGAVALIGGSVGVARHFTQEPLSLDRICAFDSDVLTEAAYVFEGDRTGASYVEMVAKAAKSGTRFEVKAANVRDVVAGLAGGRRIILYNQYVFAELKPDGEARWALLGILAHQVSHHALGHDLPADPDARLREELAADHLAGNLLRELGATIAESQSSFGKRGDSPGTRRFPPKGDRIAAISSGWKSRDPGSGAQFAYSSDDGIPTFEWPPPRASARLDLPSGFVPVNSRLVDVAETLERALREAGFPDKSYYAIPGGFALVTQLEQIEEDGRPKEGATRWEAKVRPPSVLTVRSFFEVLFLPRPGRYRLVVFLVTKHPFVYQNQSVTFEVSRDWLWRGSNRLPPSVGIEQYSKEHYCVALIYEFQQPGAQERAELRTPSTLSGRVHLERAGIWQRLGG